MTLHVLSTFLLASHWLIVAGLSVRVIMRRPAVGVSLAWLVIIASTPFLGAVAYLLLGEKRLGRRRAARVAAGIGQVRQWQGTLPRAYDPTITWIDAAARSLIVHGERTLGFPAQDGNQVELLSNFHAVFERLVADIDAAQTSCNLCFYIWHEGGRTDEVVQALMRAARRGVRCRALADAVGSKQFLAGVQACRLRQAGVELSAALPTGLLSTLFVRRDLRNHRKIAIIDERVAYTGSQNLVDPRYFKQESGVGEWVDAVVRITGPAAAALGGVFAWDWSLETGGACELPRMADLASPPPGGVIAQVLASGPDLRPEAIHQLVLTSIYASRRELVMTTPYFVPDESILTALLSAAQRGVEVTLIVPA